MKYWIKIGFLLTLGIVLNMTAFAQYDASATLSLGMGHGQTALSQDVMRNAFALKSNEVVNKASKAEYIYLGSADYSRFERQIFDGILAENKNADKVKLRGFLVDTRTRHHFFQRTRSYGLRDTYLSDILATGIAWNWEMYHQTAADKQKVVNLRNKIRNNMSKSSVTKQISNLSDEDKRKWILSFMYNNSILAYTIKKTGKLSALQKEQLIKTAQQAGVPDISAVSL
ncbi:hypothetical protein [Pedobacter antarcticus]|uniref:hypothetical protein n=1 Tax=Pedobacter antarcticus TaxID=34086 RepID=UPI0029318D45|nr:hypothetical protein [Pedobacter antarcticus]